MPGKDCTILKSVSRPPVAAQKTLSCVAPLVFFYLNLAFSLHLQLRGPCYLKR